VGVDCRADYPMLICEAAAQSVHAADKDSYYRFIHEAAVDLLDIEGSSGPIGCSAQVGDSSTLSAVQEEPVEAADDASLSKLIGDASDGDNATVVSGFYGGTHDYSDSFSSFELGFSSAGDALSFDCNDPFNGQDFVLVGDVDVLPTLSRIDSRLVKHPKAFIRMLIPVLQGCQEWRARSICSKSFEMELWTLEYCCKPTRGSEQIEKRTWLSFKSGEFTSLGNALNRFIAPKVLGKLNLSTCGECGKVNLGGQTRVSALSALPPILTIQLVGSRGILGTGKSNRRMRFAAELDMRPYIRHSHDRTQKTIYSLFLVVAHDGGSSRKGNYTSFARSSNNDWYRCRAGHHPEVVCKDIVLAANARML
ncbi:Ubiquitin carboxyl-terminal hydrolase 42, partial [Coemansia sp. IMI 209127]